MDAKQQQAVRRFAAAIEQAFSGKAPTSLDVYKAEYDTAVQILSSARDAEFLAELMKVYLGLYGKYAARKSNIQYYRSDQTFALLIEQSTRVTSEKIDLFEQWAGFLRGDPDTDSYNSFKKRYNDLLPHYQDAIRAFVYLERERRRSTQSILDYLRAEFVKQKQRPPNNNAELYDFDPAPSETLKSAFADKVDAVLLRWNLCAVYPKPENREKFHGSIDAYLEYLTGLYRANPIKLFQVVKYWQDRIRRRREVKNGQTFIHDGDTSELSCELYTLACMKLLEWGQGKKLLAKNRQGFTHEEQDYFLALLRDSTYRYVSNLEARFSALLTNLDHFYSPSKAFLDIILLTKNQLRYAELVDLNETLRIQKIWEDIQGLMGKLKNTDDAGKKQLLEDMQNLITLKNLLEIEETVVEIGQQGPELGKGSVKASSQPGEHAMFGTITIVYINPRNHNQFYIEYAGLKPYLFQVQQDYITRKLYADRIMQIYRSTIGIVYLTQFMLIAMGFLPAFIEAGFVGLIYEVGVYLLSSEVEEQAAKINPIFGKIVGFAIMFMPRPHFGPKLNTAGLAAEGIERRLITIEGLPKRSFSEIMASAQAEGKMIADFNRGILSRTLEKFTIIKEKIWALEYGQEMELVETRMAAAGGATERGGMMRVSQQAGSSAGGRGTRGIRVSASALERSKPYKLLEKYYDSMERQELIDIKKQVSTIEDDFAEGKLSYKEARQKIINCLNAAKEVAGEYTADIAIYTNFDVKKIVSIPYRTGTKTPILDRVYVVRDYETGKTIHLLAEVKGGEATRLGKVTKKIYGMRRGQLTITEVEGQWVKQASGEWYYQKFIEMYEFGRKAGDQGIMNTARELFYAAKNGKVGSFIIKSGLKMDAYAWYNDEEVIAFFKTAKWLFD